MGSDASPEHVAAAAAAAEVERAKTEAEAIAAALETRADGVFADEPVEIQEVVRGDEPAQIELRVIPYCD